MGHVQGSGRLTAVLSPPLLLVPGLPVLPCGVAGGRVGLMAPGPVAFADVGGAAVVQPAGGMAVVEFALGRVAEKVVGGDDEAVALDAGGL